MACRPSGSRARPGWREGLFSDVPEQAIAPSTAAIQPVPAAFVALCADVILHRDPQRFALLYRLLWRLAHEPALRHDPLDADMMRAQRMAKAVHRDIHKMRAFVRFTQVTDDDGLERHVAWFEPEHRIVEANADFFARRFAQMRWAILTPERCVEWDGHALSFRAGADRRESRRPMRANGSGSPTTPTSSIPRGSSSRPCSARCRAATGTTCPRPR